MAVDVAIVMAIVSVYDASSNTIANGFGIFFLLLFGILFPLSRNSGCAMYSTEIFPTSIRATGGTIGYVLLDALAGSDSEWVLTLQQHILELRDTGHLRSGVPA